MHACRLLIPIPNLARLLITHIIVLTATTFCSTYILLHAWTKTSAKCKCALAQHTCRQARLAMASS